MAERTSAHEFTKNSRSVRHRHALPKSSAWPYSNVSVQFAIVDIGSALADFLNGADRETDLLESAETKPAGTWRALVESVGEGISDADLARLAIAVIDRIRIYGGEALWQQMRVDAAANPRLARAVTAVERYIAKYVLLFQLLNGEHVDEPSARPESDLMLPNTFQRAALAAKSVHIQAPLTAEERAAFLRNDQPVWERVQDLIAYSPAGACELADTLIDTVAAHELATVGIALLEDLVTMREAEVGEYVIHRVRTSERFRVALSHAHLNPSEQFLDALITAVAQSRAS